MWRLRPFVFFFLIGCLFNALPSLRLAAADRVSDWRQFRGPTRQGLSNETELPETWSSTKNVIWRADLPGAGSSSPIIVGQKVFLTCFTGFGVPGEPGKMEDLKFHLLCRSVSDGANLFDRTIEPNLPEQPYVREDHGYASSTPVSEGNDKLIYTFFGRTGVSAFDRTYREKWHKSVGSGTHQWGSAASLVLTQDLVIVNASVESGSLVAFDKKTGERRWKISGIEESWNTPLLVDVENGQQELIIAVRGKVMGLDPASGAELWFCVTDIGFDPKKSYFVPSLVAKDGIVYSIAGERSGGGLAVRVGGKGDVTKTHRLWTTRKGSNVGSPVLHGEHLYWMHESLGLVYCADAKTGDNVYEQRVAQGAEQVYASPVLVDGKLYFVTRSGLTFVIAAKPEYELLAINDLAPRNRRTPEVFNASPAVSGGRLFVRSDRTLYCIGKK